MTQVGRPGSGSSAAQHPAAGATVVLDGSGSPFGHHWTRGPSAGGYGGNDPAVRSARQLTISGSIINSVLPVFYGAREMLAAGQWWLWYRASDGSSSAYAVFALSEGEAGSIADIQLNDIDINELVGSNYTPDKYVLSYDDREGADTQTLPTFLTAGIPGLNETRPGLAYVAIRLKTTEDSPIPSSIRLTAKITGRKISDFRTGGAAAATSNPVVIALAALDLSRSVEMTGISWPRRTVPD